jgi:UDP-N-acetylmuramate-alanine ligase
MSDFLVRRDITLQATVPTTSPRISIWWWSATLFRGNAELEEVLDRKIRTAPSEAVRDHFLAARSIVIAGTHGRRPQPR